MAFKVVFLEFAGGIMMALECRRPAPIREVLWRSDTSSIQNYSIQELDQQEILNDIGSVHQYSTGVLFTVCALPGVWRIPLGYGHEDEFQLYKSQIDKVHLYFIRLELRTVWTSEHACHVGVLVSVSSGHCRTFIIIIIIIIITD